MLRLAGVIIQNTLLTNTAAIRPKFPNRWNFGFGSHLIQLWITGVMCTQHTACMCVLVFIQDEFKQLNRPWWKYDKAIMCVNMCKIRRYSCSAENLHLEEWMLVLIGVNETRRGTSDLCKDRSEKDWFQGQCLIIKKYNSGTELWIMRRDALSAEV